MIRLWNRSAPKVNAHQLSLFTRQYLVMVNAGIPMVQGLIFYAKGDTTPLGQVVRDIADRVGGGHSLSNALGRYPTLFDALYVGLIRSGESSGRMQEALEKLADLLERQDRLRSKIVSALTYPVCLLGVAFLVMMGFVFFILPALEPMLRSVGVDTPWPTKLLLAMGSVFRSPVLFLLFGVGMVSVVGWGPALWNRFRRLESTRIALDRIPFHLPVVGKLLNRILVSRVFYCLATTIDSGLTTTHALDLARRVSPNAYVANEVSRCQALIGDGRNLSDAMADCTLFDIGAIQMIAVGEETSSLAPSLQYVAKFYDEVAEHAIESLASLLEPALMALMGLVAGFLVIASILPIVRMVQNL